MNCDLLRVGNPEEVEYVIDKIEGLDWVKLLWTCKAKKTVYKHEMLADLYSYNTG